MKKQINVTVLATSTLIQDYLHSLLNNENEINIADIAGMPVELIEKTSRNPPDIIMLCLMNDEIDYIDMIPDFLAANPHTRFIILIEPDCHYDQMKALKMGVAGIVKLNQGVRVLVGAIKQVYDGATWVSHKLLIRLLNNDLSKNEDLVKTDLLTKRELEIIEAILLGMSNKKISGKLFITEATVRHHLSSIYSKIYVDDRINLVIYAYQNGLVKKREKLALN